MAPCRWGSPRSASYFSAVWKRAPLLVGRYIKVGAEVFLPFMGDSSVLEKGREEPVPAGAHLLRALCPLAARLGYLV